MADSERKAAAPLRSRAALGARQALLTAAAAWISYSSSSLLGLHEGFWSAISSIVVMQSELSDTETSGRDRLVGTTIGALIGWGCASCWRGHLWVYALAVALSILICWVADLSGAGRLAAVAVSVIVLIPRTGAIWRVALFRFLDVSWGIVVAIAIAWLATTLMRHRRGVRP